MAAVAACMTCAAATQAAVAVKAVPLGGGAQLKGAMRVTPKRQSKQCVKVTMAVAGPANGNVAGLTYKDAGVDIDAGTELVRRIAKMTPGIGGFGGLYPFGDSYLVAGTDGVGTKLKLAFDMDKHDTIGIDLVAMSVNDIITSGAKPMFFLDYFATSHLDVDQAEQVIKGIVEGCKQSDCALLGGETAEMPGFYSPGEYDLSGFAVGSVKKDALVDGKKIAAGDVLLGLPSSGVHSNGFSLVRKVLAKSGASLHDPLPGAGVSIGEALLAPTTIYVKQVIVHARIVRLLRHSHFSFWFRILHRSYCAQVTTFFSCYFFDWGPQISVVITSVLIFSRVIQSMLLLKSRLVFFSFYSAGLEELLFFAVLFL